MTPMIDTDAYDRLREENGALNLEIQGYVQAIEAKDAALTAARPWVVWCEGYQQELYGKKTVVEVDAALALTPDAMRARGEARERVIATAKRWDGIGAVKVMHVLACPECKRLETTQDRWCDEAQKIGRQQLGAARELKDAIKELAALEDRPNG